MEALGITEHTDLNVLEARVTPRLLSGMNQQQIPFLREAILRWIFQPEENWCGSESEQMG